MKRCGILIVILALMFVSISSANEKPGAKHDDGHTAHPAEYKASITGMEFVFVKGGCYEMGDGSNIDNPAHEVCVDDFYIGKYLITQRQWKELMGHNPSNFKNCGDDCPVDSISWNDVQDFIGRLNENVRRGDPTGRPYRLPTEAEWEYAARSGGRKEKWAGTNDEAVLSDYAWFDRNSGGKTHPVGTRKPNGLGLYDMNGNVWQFVQDLYDRDYYNRSPRNNPPGPASGQANVLRGGSWARSAGVVSSASRINSLNPALRFNTSGFRLARVFPR